MTRHSRRRRRRHRRPCHRLYRRRHVHTGEFAPGSARSRPCAPHRHHTASIGRAGRVLPVLLGVPPVPAPAPPPRHRTPIAHRAARDRLAPKSSGNSIHTRRSCGGQLRPKLDFRRQRRPPRTLAPPAHHEAGRPNVKLAKALPESRSLRYRAPTPTRQQKHNRKACSPSRRKISPLSFPYPSSISAGIRWRP